MLEQEADLELQADGLILIVTRSLVSSCPDFLRLLSGAWLHHCPSEPADRLQLYRRGGVPAWLVSVSIS
jgi:hypothetical protein